MFTQQINKNAVVTFLAILAIIVLPLFTPTTTQAAGLSLDRNDCINNDGVVEVTLPDDTTHIELTNTTSGATVVDEGTTANFKTFSSLADGNYTLTVTTAGGFETLTFTVDCDPVAPQPDPDISINDQRCVNEDGVIEINTPNGLDSYELTNTDTGNVVSSDATGTSAGFLTFSGLADGNYRFEGELNGNFETLNFTVDCDPVAPQPDPDISIQDQRCVNDDGVIEINTPNGLDSYELIDTNTGNTVLSDNSGAATGFVTLSGLADSNYRFEGTLNGTTETLTFTVNCDPTSPQPDPDISIQDQRCVNDDGVIEINTPNGLDTYELTNIDTGSIVTTDNSGTGVGFLTFSGLADADYRFEGELNGNFETLNFTVDCDSTPTPNLSGSCSVSDNQIEPGDSVTFQASATGGTSPYSYSWELEGSNDDDNTQNVTTTYNNEGTYNGTVTITDNAGDSIMRTCSVSVDEDDNGGGGGGSGGGGPLMEPRDNGRVRGDIDFAVSCLPETSLYLIGEKVTFAASIDGDIDTRKADFSWESGSDYLEEDDENAYVQYVTSGIKKVEVAAEYRGNTETDTCYVQIRGAEGISLDQVPYTGPGETAGFILLILLLAGGGGWIAIKRREGEGIPIGIPGDHKRNQ